uniref:Rho-GAP domain-containing protein n=1 Tax=Macrostomum lignano TaxID=282301 RepID=A0A1I8H9C4_9PLAT
VHPHSNSPLHPSFGSLAAHKPQQQQQPLSVQAVSLFVNFLVDLKKTPSILISPLHPSFGSLAAHKPQQQQQQQQQQPLSVQAVSLFVNFLVDLKKTRPGTGLKRKRRSVLASILISPLHPSFGSLAAHKPQQQQQQQQQQPLSVQAVSLFVNFLVDLKKTPSEVSNASDMPKRQECALTISSEHSDLAAPLHPSFGSLAAHKPQQQQQQQQQQPLSVQAVSLFVNFLVDLKKTRLAQD